MITETAFGLKSAIIQDPLLLSPDTPVKEAIAAMSGARSTCQLSKQQVLSSQEHYQDPRSSCVLVVEAGQILGIVTAGDILKIIVQECDLAQISLWQVMSHPAVTLQEKGLGDLFQAITLMLQHGIQHLPIVNAQSQVIGLITDESLQMAFNSPDLLQMRIVQDTMTSEVLVASANSSLLNLAQKMTIEQIAAIVLVESNQPQGDFQPIPVGIVTERDLMQCSSLGINLEAYPAQRIMNRDFETIFPFLQMLAATPQYINIPIFHS